MKTPLLLLLAVCLNASAQTVECPKSSQGTKLSGYGVYHDKQTELQGGLRKVKAGYEIDLPNRFQYLVCEYGDKKEWIEVKQQDNIQRCTLYLKEQKERISSVKLVCR